jgi:hypothetical protein
MSAKALPREMGCWIRCDGTDDKGCPTNERRFTAVIVIGNNRGFAASEGWGRGLRLGYKRRDLCKNCMAKERELHKEAEAAKEQRKKERAEAKKLRLLGHRTKKPRKSKATATPSPTTSSPSADSAPALAT